jgi:hypothetical protein
MLLKAAVTRKKPGSSPSFPSHSLRVDNILNSKNQIQRYRKTCGFELNSDSLPVTFLHVQAFRLHMKMMLDKQFPLSPMGCVHLNNRISQLQPIKANTKVQMQCRIADHQITDKGIEFSFHCEAFADGVKVWEDTSRYLSRCKTGVAATPKAPRGKARIYSESKALTISRQDARNYARASGDFNPIHLHDISAKVLGFKRMVIHGMLSKAACLAALSDEIAADRYHCDIDFKTPIFLPAKVQLHFEQVTGGLDFELRDNAGVKPHLIGTIRAIND